jgi:hypothetical protein
MTAAAKQRSRMVGMPSGRSPPPGLKPDLVAVFRARCEARAMLVDVGMLGLHEAVDELQRDAKRDGLVERIGQDGVQAIMAAAFEAVRP